MVSKNLVVGIIGLLKLLFGQICKICASAHNGLKAISKSIAQCKFLRISLKFGAIRVRTCTFWVVEHSSNNLYELQNNQIWDSNTWLNKEIICTYDLSIWPIGLFRNLSNTNCLKFWHKFHSYLLNLPCFLASQC